MIAAAAAAAGRSSGGRAGSKSSQSQQQGSILHKVKKVLAGSSVTQRSCLRVSACEVLLLLLVNISGGQLPLLVNAA
jgi:hypothetical protein